jgi:hypothetical protein
VGHIRGAKRYPVDVVFRFTVEEEETDRRQETTQFVRLVLDRNGIQRMQRFPEPSAPGTPSGTVPWQSAA